MDVPSTNTETGEVSATNTTIIEQTNEAGESSATNEALMNQSKETGEATTTRTNQEAADQSTETTEVKEALPQEDGCTGGAHNGEQNKGDKASGQEVYVGKHCTIALPSFDCTYRNCRYFDIGMLLF